MLLPVARWDIEQQRRDRAERRQLKLLPGGKADNLRGFSGRQLAWDRLEDLRKLGELRGGAALVLAAMQAEGESTIFGVKHIERGYDTLEAALQSVGARLKTVEIPKKM